MEIFIVILFALIFIGMAIFIIQILSKDKKNKSKDANSSSDIVNNRYSQYPEGIVHGLVSPSSWKWADECRSRVDFMIDTQWPSFLSYKAWDSCQGCLSAAGTYDEAAATFAIMGDWMRIGCSNGASSSTVSTMNSQEHWFNPPRNNTADAPLELEWCMFMDASSWGSTPIERYQNQLYNNNWSAFWAFGHGSIKSNDPSNNPDNLPPSIWPNGGELDFAEWLPFPTGNQPIGAFGKGLTTGTHNAAWREWPPCCMQYGDKYTMGQTNRFTSSGEAITVNLPTNPPSSAVLGDSKVDPSSFVKAINGGFVNWGYNLLSDTEKAIWDKAFSTSISYDPQNPAATINPQEQYFLSKLDMITYNNIMRVYSRITTKLMTVWVRIETAGVIINKPIITADMSNDDVDKLISPLGFKRVFNAYADFGSNADPNPFFVSGTETDLTKNVNATTNWHQNFAFVWSAILSTGPSRMIATDPNFYRSLVFYLSDIHIRGGGNYTAAMLPPGVDPNTNESIRAKYLTDGNPDTDAYCSHIPQGTCYNRLKNAGLY